MINILNGPDAFFQCANRIQQIRHEQPIHDEAGTVMRAHRRFAQLRAKCNHLFVNHRFRRNRSHHLDQLHHRDRIEEVQPDETLRALRSGSDFRDRQR